MFEEQRVKTIGQYFNPKMIISFVGGIIAGVLFSVPLVERGIFGTDFLENIFDTKDVATEITEIKNVAADVVSTILTGENLLIVLDQKAGFSAVMSTVSLKESGWVAIHESASETEMGNILGARRFMAGKYFGSAIDLLRQTEGGKTYHAVIHRDDGDNIFNFEEETPVKDTLDKLITATFTATSAE